jgi:flagellar basal-body rod protein FlgF
MTRALYTAATGMQAQQRNIDTTANNLANVNTTGFKKSTIQFQDLLYYNERNAGVPSSISTQVPVGIHVGHGVKYVSTDKVHTQGNMENTGNDLDLSIDGMGFFQILQPNGIIAYTRDGHFNVDGLGRLVTNEGYFVLGEKGPITLRNGPVIVDESGKVYFDGKISDSLRLVRFGQQDQLQKLGGGFFAPVNKDDLPKISTEIQIKQGMLEDSNVNSMLEMTRMISATRAYESVHKALSRIDRLDEKAITLVQG